jgi:quercetin dioxygenase-like cupin family protein
MPTDAVTVAPHLYKVLLENDRVRVLEVRAQPGAKSEMHTHPSYVVVAISDAQYRFTSPDNKSIEMRLKPGAAGFFGPVEHTTEIIGTSEGHVILIELK